jgi:hypothetical protein
MLAENSIKVAIRVRPTSESPQESRQSALEKQLEKSLLNEQKRKQSLQYQQSQHLSCTGKDQIAINCGIDARNFTFDYVAGPEASQQDVWDNVGLEVTKNVLEGFNGTIIAYGQTGSGKTHTVFGAQGGNAVDITTKEERGIVPRAMHCIWEYIYEEEHLCSTASSPMPKTTSSPASPFPTRMAKMFTVTASMCEIYNERVYDLLSLPEDMTTGPNGSGIQQLKQQYQQAETLKDARKSLQIRDDPARGIFIEDLSEQVLQSPAEAEILLERGLRNRHTACTAMNHASSRSHAVVMLRFDAIIDKDGTRTCRSSQFTLVDLAGSERHKRTKTNDVRLREAGQINKSLSELGNVIHALTTSTSASDGDRRKYVQYRNSKLTMLLRDSLGGNTKTAVVATVTKDIYSLAESLITLKFAQRAKHIKNAAHINEQMVETGGLLVEELQREIATLKDRVRRYHAAGIATPGSVIGSRPPSPMSSTSRSNGSSSSSSYSGGSSRAKPMSASGFIAGTALLLHNAANRLSPGSPTQSSGMAAAIAAEGTAAACTSDSPVPRPPSLAVATEASSLQKKPTQSGGCIDDGDGLRMMCEALMDSLQEEKDKVSTAAAEREQAQQAQKAMESEYELAMQEKGKLSGEVHWLREEIDSLYVQSENVLASRDEMSQSLEKQRRSMQSVEVDNAQLQEKITSRDITISELQRQIEDRETRENENFGQVQVMHIKQQRAWEEEKDALVSQLKRYHTQEASSTAALTALSHALDEEKRKVLMEAENLLLKTSEWEAEREELTKVNAALEEEVESLDAALQEKGSEHLRQLYEIKESAESKEKEGAAEREALKARSRILGAENEEYARRETAFARREAEWDAREQKLEAQRRESHEREMEKVREVEDLKGQLAKYKARSDGISAAAASAAKAVSSRSSGKRTSSHGEEESTEGGKENTPPPISSERTPPGSEQFYYYITNTSKKALSATGSGGVPPKPRALQSVSMNLPHDSAATASDKTPATGARHHVTRPRSVFKTPRAGEDYDLTSSTTGSSTSGIPIPSGARFGIGSVRTISPKSITAELLGEGAGNSTRLSPALMFLAAGVTTAANSGVGVNDMVYLNGTPEAAAGAAVDGTEAEEQEQGQDQGTESNMAKAILLEAAAYPKQKSVHPWY